MYDYIMHRETPLCKKVSFDSII